VTVDESAEIKVGSSLATTCELLHTANIRVIYKPFALIVPVLVVLQLDID
jgi:hypothetical protein